MRVPIWASEGPKLFQIFAGSSAAWMPTSGSSLVRIHCGKAISQHLSADERYVVRFEGLSGVSPRSETS